MTPAGGGGWVGRRPPIFGSSPQAAPYTGAQTPKIFGWDGLRLCPTYIR